MRRLKIYKLLASLLAFLFVFSPAIAKKKTIAADKVKGHLSVMVLGSGGPVSTAPEGRASSSYLFFIDGKPKILLDAGGGSYKTLAQSGVNIADLEIILLTHLHVDHTADMAAFIKGIFFHNRAKRKLRSLPIRIFGPGESKATFPKSAITQYPSTDYYVEQLFNRETGIERYLHIFAKAINAGKFLIKSSSTDASPATGEKTLVDENGLIVKAIGVVHGPVPTLAYRIEYKGKSIVYSGDTNSSTDNMIQISHHTDLLIYDTAITDTLPNLYPSDKVFKALHTTPTRMGEVAATAKVKTLILSHITPTTDTRIKKIKKVIRANGYRGEIKTASDLDVYNLGKK